MTDHRSTDADDWCAEQMETPRITTYERDELIVETAFTEGQGSDPIGSSDRGLKDAFEAVQCRDVLRNVARLETPAVTTYERDELIVETAFTGDDGSDPAQSDRNAKENIEPVAGPEILREVARFETPAITTYERDELTVQTVLTGPGFSDPLVDLSDRELKDNLRPIDRAEVLGKVKRFECPQVDSLTREDLMADTMFTGNIRGSDPIADSDRDIKDNLSPADQKMVLRKLGRLETPQVDTYQREELVHDTAFTGGRDGSDPLGGSDRNIKESLEPADTSQILDDVKRFSAPEVSTYGRDQLMIDAVLTGVEDSDPAFKSDRDMKEHLHPSAPQEALCKVKAFGEPAVTTYDRDELVEETVLTGSTRSSDPF